MTTGDAHPLGIAWVTLIFVSLPVVLFYGAYEVANPLLRALLLAAVTGVVVFSVTAVLFWVTQLRRLRFPAAWYESWRFESLSMYQRLGVGRFRTWLLASPFRTLNEAIHLRGGGDSDLAELQSSIDAAEANHVIAALILLPLTAWYSLGNTPAFLPWFLLLNVVGNVYPVLLQRMNRLRVARVRERALRRGASPTFAAPGRRQ